MPVHSGADPKKRNKAGVTLPLVCMQSSEQSVKKGLASLHTPREHSLSSKCVKLEKSYSSHVPENHAKNNRKGNSSTACLFTPDKD
jgi:hypothetical protein